MKTGHVVRLLRVRRRVTQDKLAETVGMDQSNLSRLERGILPPSLVQIERIAQALGVETHEIMKMAAELPDLTVGREFDLRKHKNYDYIDEVLNGNRTQT